MQECTLLNGGDRSLIPNKIIEELFLRIANDNQMSRYTGLVDFANKGLATAYASRIVKRRFFYLIERYESEVK